MNQIPEQQRASVQGDGLRLLLDPYLCFGPGTDSYAATIAAIVRDCAALKLSLCVEQKTWEEAAVDPDVVRRGVPLWRFEPLLKIPDLPLPCARELAARFVPARNENDQSDLRLLGALQARVVDLLIADDGRLHRLASRAGLGRRVLTPCDALAWLDALAGAPQDLAVTEIEPRAAITNPALAAMLDEDCEPFDPYLTSRLEAIGTRVLVANDAGRPVALSVLTTEAPELTLAAVASADVARGGRAVEPVIAAALSIARRQRTAIRALVPPHQDHVLLLLDQLGFERRGQDRHGRLIFHHAANDTAVRPASGRDAWLLPLDAASHDRLVPEVAGATQTELFSASPAPQTLGSPIRKQLLRTRVAREPERGDLLLLFHAKSPGRIRSATVTAAARVLRIGHAATIGELLAQCAGYQGEALPKLRERLEAGAVSVIDMHWLGRLARPLSVSALIEREVIGSTPGTALRILPDALSRLSPELALA